MTAANPAPVLDTFVCHDWSSITDLMPYMSAAFREWVERPSDPFGALELKAPVWYQDTRKQSTNRLDFATLEKRLDTGRWEAVVLGYDAALSASAYPGHYVARNVVRAANDWTLEQWIARDDRLFGLVLVSAALPDEAAAEVRRVGRNERMVGVALGANALSRPFGDPIYHPIYQAAAELDLPVVIQVGSDAASVLNSAPVAGGLPATFAEYHALAGQSHMTHAASLILQSVFDLFPDLRVLLIGGGAMWVPGYVWRLDYWYKMSPSEAPWIRRLPSEYFVEHIYISTYDMESPAKPERVGQALESLPGVESRVVYGSGFPTPDSEEPAAIAPRLPASWHDGVFRDNARRLFRWPGAVGSVRKGLSRSALLEMPGTESAARTAGGA